MIRFTVLNIVRIFVHLLISFYTCFAFGTNETILSRIESTVSHNIRTISSHTSNPEVTLVGTKVRFSDGAIINYFPIGIIDLPPKLMRSIGFRKEIKENSIYYGLLLGLPAFPKDPNHANVSPDSVVRILRENTVTKKLFWLYQNGDDILEYEVTAIEELERRLRDYSAFAWGVNQGLGNAQNTVNAWGNESRVRIPDFLTKSPFTEINESQNETGILSAPENSCNAALDSVGPKSFLRKLITFFN